MIIHDRFSFECGGFVDIKRKPIKDMSLFEKQEFTLILNFIKDKLTLQYECQQLEDCLEKMNQKRHE